MTNFTSDGNDGLATFLVEQVGLSKEIVSTTLAKVRKENEGLETDGISIGIASCLLDAIVHTKVIEMYQLQQLLLKACKLPYMPLTIYNADLTVAKNLHQCISLLRLMTPFDSPGYTVSVALVNPFDEEGKAVVVEKLKEAMPTHQVRWYLTEPAGVARVLNQAYQLAARD